MAKKVTLKVDPGMWYNLTEEFKTDDPYQLITELYEARSMLLAETADQRAERDAARAELSTERDRVYNLTEEVEGAYEHNDELRFERDRLIGELADLRESGKVVVEDVLQARAWSAAWKRAAKAKREVAINWYENWEAENMCADKYYAANQRLKRACRAWWEAAQEAQVAQCSGPRGADVAALVSKAQRLILRIENWDYGDDYWILRDCGDLRAALRPFRTVRAPVVGQIVEDGDLGNRVEVYAR